jgi:hypothetical protein
MIEFSMFLGCGVQRIWPGGDISRPGQRGRCGPSQKGSIRHSVAVRKELKPALRLGF